MSYTQFTLTLFIRGFFLRQNQSWLSYTVTLGLKLDRATDGKFFEYLEA